MSNTNIKTLEGTVYKLQLNVLNVADITEYCVYGSCEPIGSCEKQAIVFNVGEVTGNSVEMYIPALKSGSYQYQVFIRRNTTNQEFMVLQGRIEVANRIGTDEEAVAPYSSIVDVALNADTVEVNVRVQEGTAGKDGKDGEKGEQGEKGDKGTVDYSLVCDVVQVMTKGRSEDNYTSYGFSYKVSKAGVICGLHIKDRTGGSVVTEEPIYVKVWNNNNTLLAKSLNAVEHSLGSTLSYEFEPFTVAENEVLKVTYHTKEGMAQNTYQVGVQACTRVVTLIEGEEGGMLTSQGGYSTTTYTAVHEWDYLERKFATIEEVNTHISSDTHLTDEQKTLLEQVANGEIGGSGSSIDWVQNTEKGVISIGKEQTLTCVDNSSYDTENSIVIGNTVKVADQMPYAMQSMHNVVIGNYTQSVGFNNVVIGDSAISHENHIYTVVIGSGAEANTYSVSVGYNTWTSNNAVAIGNNAYSEEFGIAIGDYAQASWGNITLKSGNVEVKFTSEGMTLNGEPYGQGGNSGGSGGSSGGSEYDVRKAVLKAEVEQYDTKYSGIETYQLRGNYEWVEKDGNSGNWYEYYNDLTPSGEWLYSFDCSNCNTVFFECYWITKFAAKIENCSKITEGFRFCYNLESFYTPSKLRYCYMTFDNCKKLKDFEADLSELNNAQFMFGSCPSECSCLNVESVENIANSIKSDGYGEIFIGLANELQYDNGDGKYYRCQEALQKIRNKGWSVYEMYSENY